MVALDPTIVTDEITEAFGTGGTCWTSGNQVAEQCEAQCRTELATIQDIADIVPECAYDAGDNNDGGQPFDAGDAGDVGRQSDEDDLDGGAQSFDAATDGNAIE